MAACVKTFFTTTVMPKVPALPQNEIEPRLLSTGLSAQDIRAMLRADEWCALNRETSKLCFYTIFPGANVPYPGQLRLSDKCSRFMKITFGKFD
jgi:hypothetical protein